MFLGPNHLESFYAFSLLSQLFQLFSFSFLLSLLSFSVGVAYLVLTYSAVLTAYQALSSSGAVLNLTHHLFSSLVPVIQFRRLAIWVGLFLSHLLMVLVALQFRLLAIWVGLFLSHLLMVLVAPLFQRLAISEVLFLSRLLMLVVVVCPVFEFRES
jgi:hypothetical protein